MKIYHLDSMIRGWFVGNFEPTLLKSDDVEVAVKEYKKGDYEPRHYHKIATEITVIVSGRVRMNGVEYSTGKIVLMEPGEVTDFESMEDGTKNVVVKHPVVRNDKYIL